VAEPNPYESPQLALGRSRAPLIILAIGAGLLFVLFVLWARGIALSWVFNYDAAAHANITKKIAANPQRLRANTFDKVSRELGLEGVAWDEAATQIAGASCRMYHFPGFAVVVYLEYAREKFTPDIFKDASSTEETLRARDDLLRIDSYHRPHITIDGISTREERMKRYNAMIDAQMKEINEELDRRHPKPR
jgi:hypothetical protein